MGRNVVVGIWGLENPAEDVGVSCVFVGEMEVDDVRVSVLFGSLCTAVATPTTPDSRVAVNSNYLQIIIVIFIVLYHQAS